VDGQISRMDRSISKEDGLIKACVCVLCVCVFKHVLELTLLLFKQAPMSRAWRLQGWPKYDVQAVSVCVLFTMVGA